MTSESSRTRRSGSAARRSPGAPAGSADPAAQIDPIDTAVLVGPDGPVAVSDLTRIPGLEIVGHGMYLRPNQPYALKEVIFPRVNFIPDYSEEVALTYGVPEGYLTNYSPPMPEGQALNQVIIEESWDRFEKRTSVGASVATGYAPFSLDANASQLAQVRQEEDCYYALRTSFIPLWALYIPNTVLPSDDYFSDVDIPVPFSPSNRKQYLRFFNRYGTHYCPRAWVGGKATLALTISKHTDMTLSEIQAGIKASVAGLGSVGLSTDDLQSKEKLQSNSQCIVFGGGGDELKLASLNTLDEDLYNDWLETVKESPAVIQFEAVGMWTLLNDPAKAEALVEAYKKETVFTPIRVLFNLDNRVHIFRDLTYFTLDVATDTTTTPQKVEEGWPDLFRAGFERVDAAFLGRHLCSSDGVDLTRKLFLFDRDMYARWDVDAGAVDPGYPRPIKEGWPGVDFPRIDAVVNVAPDAVYFFYGTQYIRFNMLNNRADAGYPCPVTPRWTGITFDRIDAATYWGNGKAYFFRDNHYIRYDTVTWRADAGYPKSIVGDYIEDWTLFV